MPKEGYLYGCKKVGDLQLYGHCSLPNQWGTSGAQINFSINISWYILASLSMEIEAT